MSLSNLQSWLLEEGIREDLNSITRLTVRNELDNLTPDTPLSKNEDLDWPRLLLAGSILARSDERIDQEAALRIATAVISLTLNQAFKDAGAVLLSKLSNFRTIDLAIDRGFIASNLDKRMGVASHLETQRREIERSILVQSSGAWLQVNDFQQRFWTNAAGKNRLSASAPTASGKTFLVLQWLIDQVITQDRRVTVYLAPTRALVSEIEINLKNLLAKTELIEVSSIPLPDKYKAANAGGSKLILVFTQERLHLLANVLRDAFIINLLVVDEAHKIGDNQRGVILQDAIERATRANPELKAVFISPATTNPGELLADAPKGMGAIAIESDVSTVLQNLIVANQIAGKSKLWTLTLKQHGTTLAVGNLQLANNPDGLKKTPRFYSCSCRREGGNACLHERGWRGGRGGSSDYSALAQA